MRKHGRMARLRRAAAELAQLRREADVEELICRARVVRERAAVTCGRACAGGQNCCFCAARRYITLYVYPRVGDCRPVKPKPKEKTP